MKKSIFIFGTVVFLATTIQSCNKNKCHECHYDDASGNEVPLGEKCGDELETLESNGYSDTTGNYVVHCHGH